MGYINTWLLIEIKNSNVNAFGGYEIQFLLQIKKDGVEVGFPCIYVYILN